MSLVYTADHLALELVFLHRSYGEDRSFLVGQLGYKGAVAAADDWGSPLKFKTVSPAVQGDR